MRYTYTVILYKLKERENPAICVSMHKPWGHYVKQNKSVTEEEILHDSTYMQYLKSQIGAELHSGYQELGEREMQSCFSMGIKFHLCKMNKSRGQHCIYT